jgi:hypothetical protein
MTDTLSHADVDNGLQSICWTCMKAGWECLCQWPHCRIPGMCTVKCGFDLNSNPLERVVVCQGYWPESR